MTARHGTKGSPNATPRTIWLSRNSIGNYPSFSLSPISRFANQTSLEEIQSLRPAMIERSNHDKPPKSLHDRMLGGWTGLACGCMLGKPFEIPFYIKGSLAERAARIRQWLETSKSWPLDNYVPHKNRVGETFGLEIGHPECCREHLKAMEPDTRFDMMLISLATLERSGLNFHHARRSGNMAGSSPLPASCGCRKARLSQPHAQRAPVAGKR